MRRAALMQHSNDSKESTEMQYSAVTDALLDAIKSDVRHRVDDIVDYAEHAAMEMESENDVDEVLHLAMLRVEDALAEAAQAMAREIRRERRA
jgi:hypothetical protein